MNDIIVYQKKIVYIKYLCTKELCNKYNLDLKTVLHELLPEYNKPKVIKNGYRTIGKSKKKKIVKRRVVQINHEQSMPG